MESIRFIFWETIKALSLAFLCLLAIKVVASLKIEPLGHGKRWLGWVKGALNVVIAGLGILGARTIGYDVAAEVYLGASRDDLAHAQYSKAYDNAVRAVRLRSGTLRSWRALDVTKIAQRQFASVVEDLPAFQSLSGGDLDEEDAYRFALSYFYLGDYEQAIRLTLKIISQNRFYAAPYVLKGMAYTAQKKYRDAELSFLEILQTFPNHQAAVEGLAHAYFLEGNRSDALSVLDQTAKHSFPPYARKRFDALKALYAQ